MEEFEVVALPDDDCAGLGASGPKQIKRIRSLSYGGKVFAGKVLLALLTVVVKPPHLAPKVRERLAGLIGTDT